MHSCGTYDDVNVILRLYELRREARMRQAREWFVRAFYAKTLEEAQQLCPPGSEHNAFFRMVTSYWDMAASFIRGGVLHQELFFESNRELLLVWERIRPIVPELRKFNKDPQYLGNLEEVAGEFAAWVGKRGPEAYEAFVQRVTAPPRP
jgi:hypothetical protein